MKRIFIFLLILPILSSAQKLEIAFSGGVSMNTLPPFASSYIYNNTTSSTGYKQGGINPVIQAYAAITLTDKVSIGVTLRYMSTSGMLKDDITGFKFEKKYISKPMICLIPEISYDFAHIKNKLTFVAGIQAGIFSRSVDKSSNLSNFTVSSNNSSNVKICFTTGINLKAKFNLSQRANLVLAINPGYNFVPKSKKVELPAGYSSSSMSTFSFPVTLGIGFKI